MKVYSKITLKLELERKILDNDCAAPITTPENPREYEFFEFDKYTDEKGDVIPCEFHSVSEALDYLASVKEVFLNEE